MQCASNILTAVNDPLQQRTNLLDVDLSRATPFSTDYYTDLESEWSKLDDDDHNTYYQKQLANQQFQQVGNAAILLPSTFQTNTSSNSTISVRSIMQPLATIENSELSANTNLSTSISLSILDAQGNHVLIQANQTHPIEIIIPHFINNYFIYIMLISPVICQFPFIFKSTNHNPWNGQGLRVGPLTNH